MAEEDDGDSFDYAKQIRDADSDSSSHAGSTVSSVLIDFKKWTGFDRSKGLLYLTSLLVCAAKGIQSPIGGGILDTRDRGYW